MLEKHTVIWLSFVPLVSILWWGSAFAEDVKVFDKPPSAEEIGHLLFPDKAPRTRSLAFSPTNRDTPRKSIALALPIQFALNSAEIREEAKPFLDEIGRMLTMERFRQERLLIEGHTDTSGPERYNERLSERRARAVKTYLVERFGIDPERLQIAGRGESRPLPGIPPTDPRNRRVELHRLH